MEGIVGRNGFSVAGLALSDGTLVKWKRYYHFEDVAEGKHYEFWAVRHTTTPLPKDLWEMVMRTSEDRSFFCLAPPSDAQEPGEVIEGPVQAFFYTTSWTTDDCYDGQDDDGS